MATSSARPPQTGFPSESQTSGEEHSLEDLREILFSKYRQQIAELEAELDDLERRVTDEDALVAIVTPVIGDAIRRKIRDARDEMIEVLYPIIGQTVVRSVQEAIRELARSIDSQMRSSFGPRAIARRLQARLRGVSSAEMSLREVLPFRLAEVFLIHRETGLLLWHISQDPDASPDSDLISGMLTAIRDFIKGTFGRNDKGQLDEIQYGERRIIIETGQYAYLAVVVDGIEPIGFRAEMRERIIEINNVHEKTLKSYTGDPTPLTSAEPSLRSLIMDSEPRELSSSQKRILAIVFGLLVACLATACLTGAWVMGAIRGTPTATPTYTPTYTPTNTPTVTYTSTPTNTPSPTPTNTPTPTAINLPTNIPTPTREPVTGAMLGSFRVRQEPNIDAPRSGLILELGQPVEILALFDKWYLVRWISRDQVEIIGWVPVRWVGTTSIIPPWIVTPTLTP